MVGYVAAMPAVAAPLEEAVYAYAAAHELGTVEAIYRDPDTEPGTPRTGFQQCVTALRTGRAHGVIVPRRDHLAATATDRATLLATVRAAGGVVHYIEQEEPASCR